MNLPPDKIARNENYSPRFRNLDDFNRWITRRSRKIAAVLVVRSALRIAPFLFAGGQQRSEKTVELAIPMLRCIASAWMYCRFPSLAKEYSRLTAAAYGHGDQVISRIVELHDYLDGHEYRKSKDVDEISIVMHTSMACCFAASAASTGESAATAAAYVLLNIMKLHEVSSLSSSNIVKTMFDELSADASYYVDGVSISEIAGLPLWRTVEEKDKNEIIDIVYAHWVDVKRWLVANDSNWSVWIDWWEARLDGLSIYSGKEEVYINVDEETWSKRAADVNSSISRALNSIGVESGDERAPAVPAEPIQIEGSKFSISSKYGLSILSKEVEESTEDSDIQKSLLKQLRSALPRAIVSIHGGNRAYPELENVLIEYSLLIENEDAPNVTEIWGAGAAILGMADAFDLRNGKKILTNPLEPQQWALLSQVAQLHGAFILGFPVARRLISAAERFRLASDTILAIQGPTAEILRHLSEQHDWVEEAARKFIETLEIGYHAAGWSITASGYSAYVIVRNALVVVTRHIVKWNSALATVSGGFIIAQVDPGLDVTYGAMRFILENARTITEFASPFPELRAWFAWVIDHLDEQNMRK